MFSGILDAKSGLSENRTSKHPAKNQYPYLCGFASSPHGVNPAKALILPVTHILTHA